MKLQEMQSLIKLNAKSSSSLTWQKSAYSSSVFISRFLTINKQEFNSAYYSVYSVKTNPKIHYVTVLAFYKDEFILKCGDPYFEGTIIKSTLDSLINTALKKANKTRDKKFMLALSKTSAITPKSRSCDFNQKNYTQVDKLCSHISHFLADLPEDVLEKLQTNYQDALYGSNALGVSNDLITKFNRYAFKKHILLEGDKGSGKTYAANMWARNEKIEPIFVGGHEQFESIDFLGHYIQKKDAQLIWKDGALSEAFRKAKNGKKTLLILDEILRIPKRELNILISALSPINNEYVLRTGRALDTVDEIAIEEVIKAPVKNLWVIGTTNIGDGYEVESIDEALIDRFKPIRKDTTEAELKSILKKTAHTCQFSSRCVSQLMAFYSKMQRLKKSGIIEKIVNIRHLNEAIELAVDEEDIRTIIEDSILIWVQREFDGYPNSTQVDAIEQVIELVYE